MSISYRGTPSNINILADVLLGDPNRIAARTGDDTIILFNGEPAPPELLDFLCVEVA